MLPSLAGVTWGLFSMSMKRIFRVESNAAGLLGVRWMRLSDPPIKRETTESKLEPAGYLGVEGSLSELAAESSEQAQGHNLRS